MRYDLLRDIGKLSAIQVRIVRRARSHRDIDPVIFPAVIVPAVVPGKEQDEIQGTEA
jgi:hypothetical protein